MNLLALALTLGATLCWGTSQVLGKLALREMGSLFFNGVRFGVAALAMVLGAALTGSFGGIGLNQATLVAAVSGIFGWFVATHLFFYSMKREAAHRMIPAGNAYPFWTIALASLFLGEPLKLVLPISATMIFFGTVLMASRGEEEKHWRWGVPLASMVAFLWGANAILNKFCLDEGMEVYALLVVRVLFAALLFAMALGIARRNGKFVFHSEGLKLSVASGLIAFPVGSLLYISALQIEKASVLAPISGATVLFGFLLSVFALNERPTKNSVLGMILIFSGILLMVF